MRATAHLTRICFHVMSDKKSAFIYSILYKDNNMNGAVVVVK